MRRELAPQARQRRARPLELVRLERARGDAGAAAALQRPVRRRLLRHDDGSPRTREVDVAVGPRRARVRGRTQLAQQPQLLQRRFELRADDAPLDRARRPRAPPRPTAAAAPSGSTSAVARAGRGRGRRRAPARARRGRDRRPAASARRTRASACRRRGARRGADELDEVATVRAPRSCASPISAQQDLGRRLARPAARDGTGAPPSRRSARATRARARRAAAEEPSREPDRVDDRRGEPPARRAAPPPRSRNQTSKRALCATSTASPANARNLLTASAALGARRSSRVVMPGERGDRRAAAARAD